MHCLLRLEFRTYRDRWYRNSRLRLVLPGQDGPWRRLLVSQLALMALLMRNVNRSNMASMLQKPDIKCAGSQGLVFSSSKVRYIGVLRTDILPDKTLYKGRHSYIFTQPRPITNVLMTPSFEASVLVLNPSSSQYTTRGWPTICHHLTAYYIPIS